jgi:aconitate hydratase
VDFQINPGSRQTLTNLLLGGGLRQLLDAGARIKEPGCLGCIGMGQAPASGVNSLRTFPRNFKGRSGTRDDAVYLCSPETAAASALTGHITDPRTTGEMSVIEEPERYAFNEKWFREPPESGAEVEIVRGPNIKPFPALDSLPQDLAGEVLIKVGDQVSTDIIMPAGTRVLPYRSNIPEISKFVFDILDEGFSDRARRKGGGFVVGGENYGQGSSREHAALAPRYLGVRAKIVKSYARIHKQNLINFGIVPFTFTDPSDYEAVSQGDAIHVKGLREAVEAGDEEIPVRVGDRTIVTRLDATPRERRMLLAGGALNDAAPG